MNGLPRVGAYYFVPQPGVGLVRVDRLVDRWTRVGRIADVLGQEAHVTRWADDQPLILNIGGPRDWIESHPHDRPDQSVVRREW